MKKIKRIKNNNNNKINLRGIVKYFIKYKKKQKRIINKKKLKKSIKNLSP